MSEKRFEAYILKHGCIKVKDNVTGKIYNVYDEDKDVVDLLNELTMENEQLKTKGLELLDFYERKLLDAYETEDYQTANNQVSLVRFILYEIGVLDNE